MFFVCPHQPGEPAEPLRKLVLAPIGFDVPKRHRKQILMKGDVACPKGARPLRKVKNEGRISSSAAVARLETMATSGSTTCTKCVHALPATPEKELPLCYWGESLLEVKPFQH